MTPREPKEGSHVHALLRVLREAKGKINTYKIKVKVGEIDSSFPWVSLNRYIQNLRKRGYNIETKKRGSRHSPSVFQLYEEK